ncbi:response regulator [Archangium violaceum]|uniref:hybrid sensor histidine kinase/response regulator n=1 Tax=Archangium violaceum TaxID=83451 RepID=UPI002B29E93F|nr:response regulator [Archangium violaceum]
MSIRNQPSVAREQPASIPRMEGRVLVVDDTDAKRYLVAQFLKMAGMEVLESSSGAEALVMAASQPDVVVLDVRLPDMSGFDVCRQLKANPSTTAIPVLYISALLRDEELEERLFADGADGYIPQPIEPKHLVAQTWALVRMRRAELARKREHEESLAELKATQESLRVSEERLRLALESAALGVWIYDPVTKEREWDARTKELFGLPPDATAVGPRWAESVPRDDSTRALAEVERALSGETGGLYTAEYRAVGIQDGVLRWLASRGQVHVGEDGRTRILGTVMDITERKLAEQRTTALQATTAAFANALTPRQVAEAVLAHVLTSLDAYAGAVSMVEGEELVVLSSVGYPESIVRPYRGMPLSLNAPPAEAVRTGRAVWIESFEAFERGWPDVARRLGESRSRSWGSIPLKNGERVVGVLGLSYLTPRRFSALERAHLESLCMLCAQALERARLYEEERRAKEEARQRAELEQQFLGVVSHDLRNPLQAISLGARTLQRMEKPAPEALLRTAGRIANSADNMGRMISDLLDFTRGRLGGGIPLERTANDLVRLCHEVIDEFSVTHPSSDIRLEGDGSCEGLWDGPRMRQVLSNLLSNALRHAREGTAVCVRARELPDEVELSVFNEGAPIPEELLPVLFEPFRRGMSKFRPSGSLGLGLYIVRQVVEGHGGRVEVGTGEAGTTFTIWLSQTAEVPPQRGENLGPGP